MENVEEVSEALLKIVELKTGIDKEEILNANRKRKFVLARCVYVNLLHIFTDLSETEISKKINKDRATVYHMYKVHDDLISVDKGYVKLFESCTDKYVALVCTNKYLMIEPSIIMERLSKAENEIKELKEIMLIKSSTKTNDELVTG
jgi:hypothetical protein